MSHYDYYVKPFKEWKRHLADSSRAKWKLIECKLVKILLKKKYAEGEVRGRGGLCQIMKDF